MELIISDIERDAIIEKMRLSGLCAFKLWTSNRKCEKCSGLKREIDKCDFDHFDVFEYYEDANKGFLTRSRKEIYDYFKLYLIKNGISY